MPKLALCLRRSGMASDEFLTCIRQCYVDSVVMAARRQLKSGKYGKYSISLKRLLEEIRDARNDLSNDSTRDLKKLEKAGKKIEGYADRIVAHTDKRRSVSATLQDLDRCIDVISELYRKYHSRICGADDVTASFYE